MVFPRQLPLRGILAAILLSVVCYDLAADAWCDPIDLTAAGSACWRPASVDDSPAERCAPTCIPDCFCCSRSLVAGPAHLAPESVPLMALHTLARQRWSDGVRPVVDHPPLSRA